MYKKRVYIVLEEGREQERKDGEGKEEIRRERGRGSDSGEGMKREGKWEGSSDRWGRGNG